MSFRFLSAAVFGVTGLAILLWLGFWQVSRLEWKLDLIARINAQMQNAPGPLPQDPSPQDDRFRPVVTSGRFTGEHVAVLSSLRDAGPGVRIIAVLETDDGRRILVDRGFVLEARRGSVELTAGSAEVVGNMDWPADSDSFTPAPDMARNLWFSREAGPIAAQLGAEPFLVVARQDSAAPPDLLTQPMDTAALKNDHLEYAITWFMLAAVWAVMTTALLWRIRRSED